MGDNYHPILVVLWIIIYPFAVVAGMLHGACIAQVWMWGLAKHGNNTHKIDKLVIKAQRGYFISNNSKYYK